MQRSRLQIRDEDEDEEEDDEHGNVDSLEEEREEARPRRRTVSRQERLRRELDELREHQRALFPDDPAFDALHRTTAVDEPGPPLDDVDSEVDEDYDELAGNVVSNGDGSDDDMYEDGMDEAQFFRREEEDDDEGEDLLENIEEDYQAIPALDTYGKEGMDERQYEDMDFEQRLQAEEALNKRDMERRAAQGAGARSSFYQSLLNQQIEEDEQNRKNRRGQFRAKLTDADGEDFVSDQEDDAELDQEPEVDEEELFDTEEQVNLEAFDVPVQEWIANPRTRREVMRKFRLFIMTFQDEGSDDSTDSAALRKRKRRNVLPIYEDRIRSMCASNLATLEVSYIHLMQIEPIIARWIYENPNAMIQILNEAAKRQTLRWFPSYSMIQDEIYVRIADIPTIDSLRYLRRSHLDKLIRVQGVVTRRSGVYPQLKLAYFECTTCKNEVGPIAIDDTYNAASESMQGEDYGKDANSSSLSHQPTSCTNCKNSDSMRLNSKKSQYRNYQRINLQETPGSVPAGRVPRTKEVILCNDLIDVARPGEEIEVIGIFSHNYDSNLTQKSGFPVFSTFIVANHIQRREDASAAANLTEADKADILDLARDPKIGERIVDSIAPSIFGHKHVKMAIAMSLFGAVPKNIDDKHRIRGDINVLLLGDPGTAKSQFMKYAEATAPRAVYTTGKGASAVGLTASIHKDPVTREWTLEGGALVLADRGVCLIDEFDKMNEQDRTSIHEAMEQQSISISKAGIVTSLQARCSVIAAANPIGGRYDSSHTLSENVELTDPILQRFDILCVMQDTVDPVADENLADFVTRSHFRSTPTSEMVLGYTSSSQIDEIASEEDNSKFIPQALLRKYIQYARTNIKPVLRGNTIDQEKIASLYVALRRESVTSGGVPIAVRHIESIMRMAEAHAKMHLREYVRDDDVDASISMILHSFITAQKFSVRRQLQRSFSKYLSSGEDRAHLLLHILQDLFRDEAIYQTAKLSRRGHSNPEFLGTLEVALDEFESKARDRRIYDVSEFCKGRAFRDAGFALDERRGLIIREYHG
jgi:DNA replication licensing factor MCM2